MKTSHPVLEIIETTNTILASAKSTPDMRIGAFLVLESVLHKTGNYAGFTYLDGAVDREGPKPVVLDDTRRCYTIKPSLQRMPPTPTGRMVFPVV